MILRWCARLVYVQLFIAMMVIMGYWHEPSSYTFVMSVLFLAYPVLKLIEFDDEEDTIDILQVYST